MSAAAGEPVGGPAEEARRLVEALGDWASTRLGASEEHLATGSAACRVCPVCQIISALRGDRSDALGRLGDAWTAFLGVLTDQSHPPAPSHPRAPSHPPAPSHPVPGDTAEPGADSDPPVRPVQNIDVR